MKARHARWGEEQSRKAGNYEMSCVGIAAAGEVTQRYIIYIEN